jgi:hypothetical protein
MDENEEPGRLPRTAQQEQEENRARLSADGTVNAAGEYEIIAITAGDGNGWQFGEGCLRESLSLWNGAECFVDHSWYGHSVRDLAGICHSPSWDAESKGVAVKLRAVGPSSGLLVELGKQLLADTPPGGARPGPKPRVGFSADVVFTAKAKKVDKILRVLSVDLVFNPARGGAFKRALNSLGPERTPSGRLSSAPLQSEDFGMKEETSEQTEVTTTQAQLTQDREAVRLLLDEQKRQADLAAEADKARAVRAEMCGYLLESALTSSRLPAPAAAQVRKQFAGKVFEPADLQNAITDARQLVSDLTGGATVSGPGRISAMFSSEDQIRAAVDDLLGAERDKALEGLKTAKLSGIRELYMMLTGDTELHGGYDPQRIQLATTVDFPGLVANTLNKVVANQWSMLGRAGYDWWQKIATVEHFTTLNQITGTLVGTVGTLPAVAEGAAYLPLVVGDSPETANFVKYGGYIPLTLELIDRDDTRKLRIYPRELANAGLRRISGLVSAIFTANAGTGPALADGGQLFNNVAVNVAGGHANLLVAALTAATWETVSAAVYDQPQLIGMQAGVLGTGPRQAINPRFLLTSRALQLTAKQILYPNWQNAVNITSENQQQGQPGDVITVPEWTDADDWAAAIDPVICPSIFVGERFGLMPEIFIAGNELSPAVFTNDEHRMKVRHFVAVWVNDFRALHKSNVP